MLNSIFRSGALLLLAGMTCGIAQAKQDSAGAGTGDLQVVVQRLGSTEGMIRWAVYSSEGTFRAAVHKEGNTPTRAGTTKPQEGEVRFEIPKLPHGDYALLLFHDENMNDQVDKRALGLPKERVGVSNYSSRPMRKPYWSKARFTHNQPNTLVTIQTFR